MATLLVSDPHLGSELSRAEELLAFLQDEWANQRFTRLILVGDIFADADFSRLSAAHFALLAFLRELTERGAEVVWVFGNHDAFITKILPPMLGIQVHEEYRWEWNGKKCVAIHGHQFDALIARNQFLSNLISFLFLEAQKIRFFRRYLALWLDRQHVRFARLSEKVAEGAIEYAMTHALDVVICGHTHEPMQRVTDGHDRMMRFFAGESDREIQYLNTGCWVGDVCSYVRVSDDEITLGTLRLPGSAAEKKRDAREK
jgi:UDP-2,3-diacylglucosamine pyrophosphatase LpxH